MKLGCWKSRRSQRHDFAKRTSKPWKKQRDCKSKLWAQPSSPAFKASPPSLTAALSRPNSRTGKQHMKHLQPFRPRPVQTLSLFQQDGWRLKQYAILAEAREFDQRVASAASEAAIKALPRAGKLEQEDGNHGVGFQIVHFAEVAVVSPVFYWQWGSVLANLPQMRAPWEKPTEFAEGVTEVAGCVWEMQIVQFEVDAWIDTLLAGSGDPDKNLGSYLSQLFSPGGE